MCSGIGLFRDYVAEHNTPDLDIRFAWETETNTFLPKVLSAIIKAIIALHGWRTMGLSITLGYVGPEHAA